MRTLRALFYGRFQPFHLGHLKVLTWILERFDEVLILIGMADESHTPLNPFTADERAEMIERALAEIGIDYARVRLSTMPTLPVGLASAFVVRHHGLRFDAVVTGNRAIARAFRDAGFRVVSPPQFNRDKLQGRVVRELMAKGDPAWRNLVPRSVADYLDEIDAETRIRTIMRS